MDDYTYHLHMTYDLPEDFHEPHDYPPRKTRAKQAHFNLPKPYQEKGAIRMNVYHVKGVNLSLEPPMSYDSKITARDSSEATQAALMEMNWQGKITSCRMVS